MIVVDAMIWVYNCDVKASEYKNVHLWLEGENEEGIIDLEEILVNTVIIMEVVHNLRRRAQLPPELVYDYILKMLALKNMTTAPLDRELLHASMHVFERYYEYGIFAKLAVMASLLSTARTATVKP